MIENCIRFGGVGFTFYQLKVSRPDTFRNPPAKDNANPDSEVLCQNYGMKTKAKYLDDS